MAEKICQSCAMTLNEEKYNGTNNDGSKNEDYCIFCFNEGKFTYEITMNEMITAAGSEESGRRFS